MPITDWSDNLLTEIIPLTCVSPDVISGSTNHHNVVYYVLQKMYRQPLKTRSSAVAEGPRDVHVIVVMSSLNMCEMATNCVVVYAKSRFSGLQFFR